MAGSPEPSFGKVRFAMGFGGRLLAVFAIVVGGAHLQPHLLRWSVPVAPTSVHRISDLIEASGKGVPVYLSPSGSRESHPLARPAPDSPEDGPAG